MCKYLSFNCVKNLLQGIDIFGLAVTFRIFSQKNHKTHFGGFVTLLIVFPSSVIQQQNYVFQPEPFYFTPKLFSFAFGLQDSFGNNFIDERVYKVKSTLQINRRVLNNLTGKYDLVISQRDVSLVRCTLEHFQVDGTQDYFIKLPIDQLYCFALNETQIYIEGEFSALNFTQFNIQISECTGNQCLDTMQRQKILFSPRLGIYTIDNIIQITNNGKPYVSVGKNLFWVSGLSFQKEIRYNLVNNYVHTDDGLIAQNNRIDRIVSYYDDTEQILDRSSPLLFNFYIDYEKNKEIVYYRQYPKLVMLFSQLGGTFNVLVGIGCLLCWPISQLELNRKIINSAFNIDQSVIDLIETKKDSKKKSKDKSDFQIKNNQIQQSNQNYSNKQDTHIDPEHAKNSQKLQSETAYQSQDRIFKIFSQSFSQVKLKLRDYIMTYFNFFCSKKSNKSLMIKYGTDILYSHIDIFNIVNKLIELEKLKHLLLNEDQIKLFDYLPKPTLKLPKAEDQSMLKNNKLASLNKVTLQVSQENDQQEIKLDQLSNQSTQVNNQSSLLFMPQKTSEEKAKEAHEAFNKIINQSSNINSDIDKKLISMIDINLLSYFKQNFDQPFNKSIQFKPFQFNQIAQKNSYQVNPEPQTEKQIVQQIDNFVTEEDCINPFYESKAKHLASKVFGETSSNKQEDQTSISESSNYRDFSQLSKHKMIRNTALKIKIDSSYAYSINQL
ncbi:hypothetical protein TTHERM_000011938 (macronuclear) [Tetrahymena thermophila SB210]|uniref:Uncharacterized protein n=1 Tax=Tetrahymena thermophila (strain SB210) TaxID=312017 RepID=W7XLI4_TETTS|nr:hypothetical protein TTHERM_000011938 [Tetrahymena thermophila SB210]EWS76344.1 hypothetical protein TTHERM_000011938 [Tetrahymena thermophila SB210]|eukprot:XP_012651128.1 hypothetical protein TTHERM_000011938 [Tetrahymena thermophila SB210]